MKKNVILAAALAAALAPGASFADSAFGTSGVYAGADIMHWTYSESPASDVSATGLRLRLGTDFNKYFAVEGQLGFIGSGSTAVLGYSTDVKLDYVFGLYARGNLPITDQFRLYGLAGLGESSIEASALGISITNTYSGFSGGGGLEYDFSPNAGVNLDYMLYTSTNSGVLYGTDATLSALSLGATYRF